MGSTDQLVFTTGYAELASPWSQLCRDPEGWGPFSDTRTPDFTPCFEDTVVMMVPAAFLLIFGVARLWFLSKRNSLPLDMTSNWLYFAKMSILALLAIVTAAIASRSVYLTSSWIDNIQVLDQILGVFVVIFVIALHYLEYTRERIASAVLLFYWLMVIITQALKLHTLISLDLPHIDVFGFVLYAISLGLSVTMFVLENIPRPKSEYMLLDEDEMDCPEATANIFSRLTFSWLTPLMKLGYKQPLLMDDLWNLKPEDQAAVIAERFEQNWEKEMKKKNPSLLRVLVATLGGPFIFAGVLKAVQDVLQFTQPLLLRELMGWVNSYSSGEPMPAYRGTFIAIGMFFTAISQTMFLHQYFQLCFATGMRIRAALVTAIYKKTMVLSNASRQASTVGEIVNHMSVDAQRLMDLCTYFHIVWSGPFQIALALYFLWQTMGPSTWAGVGVLILAIPLNTYLAKKMRTYQKKQMGNKDARVKFMNEILNGIRVIKLYAWEKSFLKRITYIRNDLELAMLKRIGILNAVQNFTWASIPFLVSLSTFAIYVAVSPVPLTSQTAFVAISLFNLLQFPLAVFPNVISSTIEASVSLYRIEGYLLADEIDPNAVQKEPLPSNSALASGAPLVDLKNASFKWNPFDSEPTLENMNFAVKKGELVAVVGRVGSGKSSLMSALLGDMQKTSGTVKIRGSVAYASQQPWIMNATLRDNILFGAKYDADFYETVLEACSLKADIAILTAGDMTEIGERGINLSGGQKARISVARAVYARADVYVFDDPLSAVDAHVGKHIFDHVLGPDGLLKTKARVLVTHGIAFLPKVDKLLMLRHGRVILNGSYNELMKQKTELYQLVSDFGSQSSNTQEEDETTLIADVDSEAEGEIGNYEEDAPLTKTLSQEGRDRDRQNSVSSVTTLRRPSMASLRNIGKKQSLALKEQLMTVEESAKGSVDKSVYWTYAKSCSAVGVALLLLFQIIAQASQIGSSLWIKYWSDQNQKTGSNDRVWVYLGIYAAIGWSSVIFTVLQTLVLWVFCAIRSAKILHADMLIGVLRSPMSFFDTTPLGRIINRFSKDQHTVDEVLPRVFSAYFRVLFSVISTVCVISVSTPPFIFLIVPLIFIYMAVQRYYLQTSRELKRLDSVSKSPIYSYFQQTLSGAGVPTIRAYQQQERFMHENRCRLDENQKAYFPSISCNRWLAVRLEFLGSIIIFGAAIFAVIEVVYGGSLDAGLVGLSVSYALGTTQALNWVIRSFCEIETNIVSVERVKEYIDLPSEAPEIIETNRPSHIWPEKGMIEYRDYSTRYRPGLDLVLKGISFKVAPKEKIGIVGRTGAGKSSLSLSLFRIVEAAAGQIVVDGVDISTIGLHDLRSRLTIIPQDPVLFAGTVRENLDPFNAHDDVEIWQVLENSHLKDHIAKLEGKLNAVVLEGGENFSVGQRQLICLARALLRRTTVLVLDEATAAIDVETDSLIQETIRREFVDCTILTIAHRINTVMDSDKILVLDKGVIAEYDTPKALLAKPDSVFYSLAKQAGQAE
ncbi:hypothetical protein INT43_001612 [Umbelopsis isabellina]|uniref:Uncharacterized protein n=1 Tax=Mortierella isabellina TaxID=91625 RepID=A0A8H7PRH3_MORIS|nr:hypothetical protein INT43_001612 [Umbelopsis isabellina]